jgi:hypothetical protein
MPSRRFLTHFEASLPLDLPLPLPTAPLRQLPRPTARAIFLALEDAWYKVEGDDSPSPPLMELLLAPAVSADEALGVYLEAVEEMAELRRWELATIEEGVEEGEEAKGELREEEGEAVEDEEDESGKQWNLSTIWEVEEEGEEWETEVESAGEVGEEVVDTEEAHTEEGCSDSDSEAQTEPDMKEPELEPTGTAISRLTPASPVSRLTPVGSIVPRRRASTIIPVTPTIIPVPPTTIPSSTIIPVASEPIAALPLAASASTETTGPSVLHTPLPTPPEITVTDVDALRANPLLAELASRLDALPSAPDLAGSLRIRDLKLELEPVGLGDEPWMKIDWKNGDSIGRSVGRFFAKVKRRASLAM